VIIEVGGFNQHSPAGQHHVPLQEEHHIAGNEPVSSVLALSLKSFLHSNGRVLILDNTFEGIILNHIHTDMFTTKFAQFFLHV
jgi:hypothetical protein